MFCKYCGKQIDDDSSFCSYCGEKIIASSDVVLNHEEESNAPHVKVEIVSGSGKTEEERRQQVISILKEMGLLVLFVGIAFIVALLVRERIKMMRYPIVTEFEQQMGEYHLGEFRWDSDIRSRQDLMNINQARKDILRNHAESISHVVFWVLLFGLPICRYVVLLVKWLSKSKERGTTEQDE